MDSPFNFTRRRSHVVANERRDMIQPSSSIPRPITNNIWTLNDYLNFDKSDVHTGPPRSLEIKKLILDTLKEMPELWTQRCSKKPHWELLGFNILQRTGMRIGTCQLMETFRNARKHVNAKIRKCWKEGLSKAETEIKCSNWDLFENFRFFFEFKCRHWQFPDDCDDLVVELDTEEGIISNPSLPPNEVCDQNVEILQSATKESIMPDVPEHYLDFEQHLKAKIQQALNKHPGQEKLLKNAIFTTLNGIENRDHKSLEELFSSLSSNH